MIKGIIFDMDGVLADTQDAHAKAFAKILLNFKIKLKDNEWDSYFGRSDKQSFIEFFEKNKIKTYDVNECIKHKRELFLEEIDKIKLFPDVESVLKECKKEYKVALASNATEIEVRKILKSKKIEKYFDFIMSRTFVHRPKPDPQIYDIVAYRLELKPKEFVVVEDSVAGITAAKKAGMKVIAVTFTNPKDKLQDADFIVDKLTDIPNLIENM